MKAAAYSVFSYLVFLATFTYFQGFIEGMFVPRTIDSPSGSMSLGVAILVDCSWFVLFAVQHSAMARPAFKRAWTRIIPAGAERSTYVLASSLMLVLLFGIWQPITIVLWEAPAGLASWAVRGLSFAGWGLVLAATFAIDHFELFGIRQVIDARQNLCPPKPELRTPLLYRIVRHPLYLGFIIAFWAAPVMTVGHALLAAGLTAYVFIGIYFEERDLVRTFGEQYLEYRQHVPALLPWPRPASQPTNPVPSA